MKNNFMITERDLGYSSDNAIVYNAGPIKITPYRLDGYITLSSNRKWVQYLNECYETAKEAWELDSSEIIRTELEIHIKYDLKILKLFVERTIVFL